jgi:hypothetical protein
MTHKQSQMWRTGWLMAGLAAVWFILLVFSALEGWLATLYQPLIAAIVAVTIVAPTVWYMSSSAMRDVLDAIGHRNIINMHIWRIPAAILFFWYGLQGELPPLFWILAGTGDFLAGSYAIWTTRQRQTRARIRRFHIFGFGDFIVAVGTGLTYTLLMDPRMAPIAQLPLAFIPLFGVGISGASHLMAFDMLRRNSGFNVDPVASPRPAQL